MAAFLGSVRGQGEGQEKLPRAVVILGFEFRLMILVDSCRGGKLLSQPTGRLATINSTASLLLRAAAIVVVIGRSSKRTGECPATRRCRPFFLPSLPRSAGRRHRKLSMITTA
jgi:hypothetical protein